jgi:hypothetical protein
MLAYSMFGAAEWGIILIFFLYLYLLITTVMSIMKNDSFETNTKLLWILILILAPFLGILLYHLVGKNMARK